MRNLSLFTSWVICAITALATSAFAGDNDVLFLQISRSSHWGDIVGAFRGDQGNPTLLSQTLTQRSTEFDEQMAVAIANIGDIHLSDIPAFEDFGMQIEVGALGLDLTEGGVDPRLQALNIFSNFVTLESVGHPGKPSRDLRLGLVLGMAVQKSADADFNSLGAGLPWATGVVFGVGLTQGIELKNRFLGALGIDAGDLSVSLREIYFHSTAPTPQGSPIAGQAVLAMRWRIEGELDHFLLWKPLEETRVGIDMQLGPQPLPFQVLPTIWDFVHRVSFAADPRALVGGGLSIVNHWSARSGFDIKAGYYGGYLGGGVIAEAGPFNVALSSFGIESGKGFHELSERLYTASASFQP